MSVNVAKRVIECDGQGCSSVTKVPITFRQWYDSETLELRNESSAAGWMFMSCRAHDRHYCPLCSGKYMNDRPKARAS